MRETIKEEVKNVVQRSAVSNSGADNKTFPVVQVNYFGGTEDCEVIMPYGLYYMPPIGSLGVMFNINGESEYRAGIFNVMQQRVRVQNAGECVFANPIYGQQIYYNNQGDITVICPGNKTVTIDKNLNITSVGPITVTSPLTTFDGNVVVTGTITADGGSVSMSGGNIETSGDVVASGISLNSHVHGGVATGGGTTDGPE